MFRCEKCGTVVGPGTAAHQVVIQERPKEYPARTREVTRGRGRRRTQTIDSGGHGREIVRELTVCPTCAEELHGTRETSET